MEEECMICALPLVDLYCEKISCSHQFHYECLLKTYISCKRQTYKHTNRCPYCREKSGYLSVINGLTKVIPHIHYNPETPAPEPPKIRCQHTLIRGKNKGKACGKKSQMGFMMCKTHHSKVAKI